MCENITNAKTITFSSGLEFEQGPKEQHLASSWAHVLELTTKFQPRHFAMCASCHPQLVEDTNNDM